MEEIRKILKNLGLKHAEIVGEMAGYENGKIIPFDQTESIIKNPKSDKTKVHWFPYQILEIDGTDFSTTLFDVCGSSFFV